MEPRKLKKAGKPAALLAAGVVAGAVVAGTISASAADAPSPRPAASAPGAMPHNGADPNGGPRRDGRPAETPLTGTTKSKVEAAVLAKYPHATIDRTETDRDGGYESHITTAEGKHLTVEVGKNFAVTGIEAHGPC